MATKVCPGCKIEKDLKEFYPARGKKRNHPGRCIECGKEYGKEWYRKNKAKNKRRSDKWRSENRIEVRDKELRNKYGITLDDYNEMLKAQDGVCALCGKTEKVKSRAGKIRALAVDHCHDTGRVRGLLCYRCNQLIAGIGDKLESAEKLVLYMEGVSQGP